MSTLALYGFGYNDRSSKVRWVAHELGVPVEERRLAAGDHRKPPYTDLNPYGMVPTAIWKGRTHIESTAMCTFLAESHPDSGLVVAPGEPARADYLEWVALFAETLEAKLVENILTTYGVLPEVFETTTRPSLDYRLPTLLKRLPSEGFLVADRFTLADVQAGYSLRLAINAGRIERSDVAGYLDPLVDRPGAKSAHFFDSLKS